MAEPKTFKVKDKSTGKVFTIREKTQSSSVNESKPTFLSELSKVTAQGVSGLAFDLPNVGKKPISELFAGEVGSSLEGGYERGLEIRKNPKELLTKIAASGPQALMQIPAKQETLHSKYGFPIVPEPETYIGRILGIANNIAGQIVSGEIASRGALTIDPIGNKILRNQNVKIPSSGQVKEAMAQVQKNVKDMVKTNDDFLQVQSERNTTTRFFKDIKVNEELTKLTENKRITADKVAVDIHENLSLKAHKNLNEKFFTAYQKAGKGKKISFQDVEEALDSSLKESGVLGADGEINKFRELSTDEKKFLKFYEDVKNRNPNDVIRLDSESVDLMEFDKALSSHLKAGNQYGPGQHFMTNVRRAFSEFIAPLKDVKKEFSGDYKDRDALFSVFKPFGKKGDFDVKTGIGILENLADDITSNVYPANQRMMDFLKKYTGVDPSVPVKNLGKHIKNVKYSSVKDDFDTKISFAETEAKIRNKQLESELKASKMNENLNKLLDISIKKENERGLLKNIVKYGMKVLPVPGNKFIP